jgi:alanine racemase
MSAGYADGYGRCFSNNAEVVVRGRRYPVVGRVCMDLTMIDLTGCDDVEEGDDVILLGHGGGEAVDAAGLAARAGTIPYEVLTSIGSKARKRYRAGQDGTCCAAAEASPGAEQNKHR